MTTVKVSCDSTVFQQSCSLEPRRFERRKTVQSYPEISAKGDFLVKYCIVSIEPKMLSIAGVKGGSPFYKSTFLFSGNRDSFLNPGMNSLRAPARVAFITPEVNSILGYILTACNALSVSTTIFMLIFCYLTTPSWGQN